MTKTQDRLVAMLALLGALLLIAGTLLHPSGADPAVPDAAFAEYAADPFWVTSHLTQLAGVALMLSSQVLLAACITDQRHRPLAQLALMGAAASLAAAAILQAVDGVALKPMVDAWAVAPDSAKPMAMQAALAVRHIEIGLAAVFGLVGGLTICAYAALQWRGASLSLWLALLGALGGLGSFAGGLAVANTGFSGLSMAINMPGGMVLVVWMIALSVTLLVRGPAQ